MRLRLHTFRNHLDLLRAYTHRMPSNKINQSYLFDSHYSFNSKIVVLWSPRKSLKLLTYSHSSAALDIVGRWTSFGSVNRFELYSAFWAPILIRQNQILKNWLTETKDLRLQRSATIKIWSERLIGSLVDIGSFILKMQANISPQKAVYTFYHRSEFSWMLKSRLLLNNSSSNQT